MLLETSGPRLEYWTEGTGAPLILLHGFPQDLWEWRHVVPGLAEHCAVFALNLRGFGRSDKHRVRLSQELLARDIIDFMDALGLERASLVGHDFGGVIAANAALLYPQRFNRVAVLDATITEWLPRATHGFWFKVDDLAETFFARHHRAFIDSVFAGARPDYPDMPVGPFPLVDRPRRPRPDWCDNETLDHYRAVYADPDSQGHAIGLRRDALPFHHLRKGVPEYLPPSAIAGLWRWPGGFFANPYFGERLCYAPQHLRRQFHGPSLFMFTPTVVPEAFARTGADARLLTANPAIDAMGRHFPNTTYVPLKAGHFLPEEQPLQVVDSLLRWLKEAPDGQIAM